MPRPASNAAAKNILVRTLTGEFYPDARDCKVKNLTLWAPAGRIHEGRQGARGFENLSVWFGPEAGVRVVWRVERLWRCQDGQGQRGFRRPEA
jgi:hypothetical protein